MQNRNALLLVAACGLAASADAQPYQVTVSGATLQQNFFVSAAATNDAIDVDLDGRLAVDGDQLSPALWHFHYRAIGSGNGIDELLAFGGTPLPIAISAAEMGPASDQSVYNRAVISSGGAFTGVANPGNPGGVPFNANAAQSFSTIAAAPGAGIGVHVDVATADVPFAWFAQVPGPASPFATPGDPGYGANPRVPVSLAGEPVAFGNTLIDVSAAAVDPALVVDFATAVVAISPIANYGLGYGEITVTQARYLTTTGRNQNGENVMVMTRDAGSGTRNGFQNAIGIDPSWGIGENIGAEAGSSAQDRLGPDFQPSNKGGSSRMEETVSNHRLGFGYTGSERGPSGVGGDEWGVLGVINDVGGAATAVWPTLANVLENDPLTGYVILAPGSISTVGDPRAYGEFAVVNGVQYRIGGSSNGATPMANPLAAAWVNNLLRSADAFAGEPEAEENAFTPGEFLAARFILPNALAFDQDLSNPTAFTPNTDRNANLVDFYLRGSFANALTSPLVAGFDASRNGEVPFRTAGVAYTDGNTGNHYVLQNGSTLAYGAALNERNARAGDFNGDGARTNDDIPGLVAAWIDRQGGPAYLPGADLGIEIIGDFDGDGSFTEDDVRYFADGLSLVGGRLDRPAGFTAVDQAFPGFGDRPAGNFFGTELAHGSYSPGDSRADVAGAFTAAIENGVTAVVFATTPGFGPAAGADGVIDAADIEYVAHNGVKNPFIAGGSADWNDLAQAVHMDLAADMDGDFDVDLDDVLVVIRDILETEPGDVNLDGVIDSVDAQIIQNAIAAGLPAIYGNGDVNFDGVIDAADLALVAGGCPADFNGDGSVNVNDLLGFLGAFRNQDAASDFDRDGSVNVNDLLGFLGAFRQGC